MAWNDVIDAETGEYMDGDVWESARAAIAQLQESLGPSEGLTPVRLAKVGVASTGMLLMDNIPQHFSALKVEGVARHTGTTNEHRALSLRFNGDNAGPYQHARHVFDGALGERSPLSTTSATLITFTEIGDDMSTFECYIPRYSFSEPQYVHGGGGSSVSGAAATAGNWHRIISQGRWSASVPITQIYVIFDGSAGDTMSAGEVSLWGMP